MTERTVVSTGISRGRCASLTMPCIPRSRLRWHNMSETREHDSQRVKGRDFHTHGVLLGESPTASYWNVPGGGR